MKKQRDGSEDICCISDSIFLKLVTTPEARFSKLVTWTAISVLSSGYQSRCPRAEGNLSHEAVDVKHLPVSEMIVTVLSIREGTASARKLESAMRLLLYIYASVLTIIP